MIPLVERMDYLGAAVEQPGVLPLGRAAARDRIRHPGPGRLDSRADCRAAAAEQPPGVAGHPRHGSRRRVGDALLLPRARAAAEHQRDARRLPHVPELPADWRAARGSAARVPRGGQGLPRRVPGEARRLRPAAHEEPGVDPAHQGVGRLSREETMAMGLVGPIARAVGIPYDVRKVFPYLQVRDVRFHRADAVRRRRLRAVPREDGGDAAEHADLPAGARADHADRRVRLRRLPHRAAAQGSRLHGDGSAHPALPAVLAGVQRAGGRVPTCRSRARAASTGSTSSRTAPTGRIRVKARAPSFIACQALPKMVVGGLIADVIAVIGSTDVVMGDVDR